MRHPSPCPYCLLLIQLALKLREDLLDDTNVSQCCLGITDPTVFQLQQGRQLLCIQLAHSSAVSNRMPLCFLTVAVLGP